MALKPCRECGREISDQAEICPNCGIRSPSGRGSTRQNGKPKRRGTSGCLIIVILLVVIIGAITSLGSGQQQATNSAQTQSGTAASASPSVAQATPQTSPGASSNPVYIGNHGQINATAIACQNKQDLIDFDNAYIQADIAKDDVGKTQAAETALGATCTTVHAGETGLIIDSSGILIQRDEIRLDSDSTAYWVDSDFVSPIPGQPNNP